MIHKSTWVETFAAWAGSWSHESRGLGWNLLQFHIGQNLSTVERIQLAFVGKQMVVLVVRINIEQ